MKFGLPLLPTTLVGSYAQPDWRLIDRQKLGKRRTVVDTCQWKRPQVTLPADETSLRPVGDPTHQGG